MSRKYFGTDGIRGRVGEFPITPDFVLKLGWAAGKALAAQAERPRIVIGKDTRISGYMFESALEAGLVAAGVDVLLTGPMPTPAIAYLTRTFRADAGIVISASHNPYHDNGIKFFSAQGTKLPDGVELAIEAMIDAELEVVESDELGKVRRINDAAGRYIEYCKGTVSNHLDLRGLRLVVDTANGATYHIGPDVFRELGAEVVVIGDQPDGLNINRGVGSTHLGQLSERVLAEQADLGIAFDGDGDRVLMVDHRGVEVDGDELLFLIATHQQARGELEGGVVGTLMTNLGMELALAERDIPFVRAKVGDRYVNEQLLAHNWQLGGESSGHLICRQVSTTGDGVVAALQVLCALQASGQKLAELKSGMTKCPMTMINVRMPKRQPIDGNAVIEQAVQAAESELGDQGRVLLRPSGTEPVVRVMVEGRDAEQVAALCQQLADQVAAELGAA